MKNYKMPVHCYHQPKYVVAIDGIQYYCADKDGVIDFTGDAVFNLTGVPNVPQLSAIPELAPHVDALYKEIVIAWPDFGLPRVKPSFWQAMHDYAREQNWHKVCIHCEGGHGRTGTAMASVMIACLKWDVPKAVNHIRKKYCDKVVETHDQCDYLCMLDYELNSRETDVKDIPVPASVTMAKYMEQQKAMDSKNLKGVINKTMGYWHDEDDNPWNKMP